MEFKIRQIIIEEEEKKEESKEDRKESKKTKKKRGKKKQIVEEEEGQVRVVKHDEIVNMRNLRINFRENDGRFF